MPAKRRLQFLLWCVFGLAATTVSCNGIITAECKGKPPSQAQKCCCQTAFGGAVWTGCSKDDQDKCSGSFANEFSAPCACEEAASSAASRQPAAERASQYHLVAAEATSQHQRDCAALCAAGDAECLLAVDLSEERRKQLRALITEIRAAGPVRIGSTKLGEIFGIPASDPSLTLRQDTIIADRTLTNTGYPVSLVIHASGERFSIDIPEQLQGRLRTTGDATRVQFADGAMAQLAFSNNVYQAAFGGAILQLDATKDRLVATTTRACLELSLVDQSYLEATRRFLRTTNYLERITGKRAPGLLELPMLEEKHQ
jgi:hypothetical protein